MRLPGAEQCIAQPELAARVEARLGRAAFVRPADAIMLVEGRVAPTADGGFEAVLAVSDRDGKSFGERSLTVAGSDCRQLDELVSFVIAVTLRGGPSGLELPPEISAQLEALFGDEPSVIDPQSLPVQPPSSQRDPQPSITARSDQPVPVPARDDRARERRFELRLDAGMAVTTGVQPDGTLAPAARVQVAFPAPFAVALAGGIGLPQREPIDDPSSNADGSLDLRAWYGALSLCATVGRALGSALDGCARFGLGRVTAQASGFVARNGELGQLWTELGPELSLRAPLLAPLHARLSVALPVRLSRPQFVYLRSDGKVERAFRVAGLGVIGELALGVSLP